MHIAKRFASRGWESIITHIVPLSESVVHEFYSNMNNFNDSASFTIYFRGQYIDVDPSVLAHCLGIPRAHKPTYPYSTRTRPSPNIIANFLSQQQLNFQDKEFTTKKFTFGHLILRGCLFP